MRIFKNNFLVPRGFEAITIGTWIFIRHDCSNYDSTIVHELVHVEQFKRTPIIFWFKYLFNQSCRLAYETEAYAKQIKYYDNIGLNISDDLINLYSKVLSESYRLSYSFDHIKHYLQTYYNNLST